LPVPISSICDTKATKVWIASSASATIAVRPRMWEMM
jgi:hypothetical protein